MHVHVLSNGMRTSIEIKPEHPTRLLELAARGASTHTRKRARLLEGTLSENEARALRDATVEIRASWR